MASSRAVALVSHGRGSGGRSIATPGTSCTWATNRGGQAWVAACGSTQGATTAKMTMPAVLNRMMNGASEDGTRYNYTTRGRRSVTSTRHTECSHLDQHVAETRRLIAGMPRWRPGRTACRPVEQALV